MHERGRAGAPRVGFVAWNSFQVIHALDVARALPGSMLVIEKRAEHIGELPAALLTEAGVPTLVWERGRMAELDGVFDVIVCQTPFSQIERFEKSRIAMLQYGLAKEPHNYGAWRSLADLCLVYGPYSAQKVSYFCPTLAVGNPRLDQWESAALAERARALTVGLDPTRPTLLYAPTWGELSTQETFLPAVMALGRACNVLVKLHHNTDLLEQHRKIDAGANVRVFGANDDVLVLLRASDLVLSDYSGVIFDALACDKPVLLLQSESTERFGAKLDAHSLEFARRDEAGVVVPAPDALEDAVEDVLRGRGEPERRRRAERLADELYVRGGGAVGRAARALEALAEGTTPPLTQMQLYVREAARAALRKGQASEPVGGEKRALRMEPAHVERRLLEGWQRAGRSAHVLQYVKLRQVVAPRLYLYRLGIRAAQALGDDVQVGELVAAARRHFPQARVATPAPAGQLPRRGQHAANETSPRVAGGPVGERPVARLRAFLSSVDYRARARDLLENVPRKMPWARDLRTFSSPRSGHDDARLQASLMLSQRDRPRDVRLLRYLAGSLMQDGQPERAHVFLRLLDRLGDLEGAVQRLVLEREQGWHAEADTTLRSLLRHPPAQLLPLLATSHPGALPEPSMRSLDPRAVPARSWRALRYGLRGSRGRAGDEAPALDPWHDFMEQAWHNEHASELVAFEGGVERTVALGHAPSEVVELFVPASIFRRDAIESAHEDAVRVAFRSMFEMLSSTSGLSIVPRLQLSSREAVPRLGGRVIAHRTQGDQAGWLHVGETRIEGHVSLDSRGYGSSSSIATDFARIERETAGVSLAELDAVHRRLLEACAGHDTRHSHRAEDVPHGRPYLFVPTQRVGDGQLASAAFGLEELLETLVAEAQGRFEIVVRRDPGCRSVRVQRLLDGLGHRIVLATGDVHRLIASATGVYTLNAELGLDALLHLKPVVVAGPCDYAYAATTVHDVRSLAQVVRAGARLDVARSKRFLWFYSQRYAVRSADVASVAARLRAWLETTERRDA